MRRLKNLVKSKKFQVVFQVAIIAIAIVLLAPQAKSLGNSWSDATFKFEPLWILTAILFLLLTNVFALLVYVAISPKSLPIRQTFLAQLSTGFTNRIAPSGIGAAGLYAFFLSRILRISKTDAAVLVGANGLIGYLAFNITTIGIFAFSGSIGKAFDILGGNPKLLVILIIGLSTLLLILVLVKQLRKGLFSVLHSVKKTFTQLRKRPRRLTLGLIASICITMTTLLMLYASIQAAGVSISIDELVLVYIAGMLAVVASPTPSGLGAVELAMTAALTATTGAGQALAAILVYRIVSFWLPIIPGYVSFNYLVRKKLL